MALTILRCGLGRDSLAMMCLLFEGTLMVDGVALTVADVDALVFTDTGAEWRTTYALIPRVRAMCEARGLRFIAQMKPATAAWVSFLETRERGSRGGQPWRKTEPDTIEEKAASGWYHSRAPIMADYGSKDTIVAFSDPSCTHNHKILPNRKLLDDLSRERFGIGNRGWAKAVRDGSRKPHRMLIGIAADEAHRAIDGQGPDYETDHYPLVEMGITKAQEAAILRRHGLDDVHKSGCVMCKYQPVSWYWALAETDPEKFAEVVAYEARAAEKNAKLLIFPKTGLPLPEAVKQWRAKNPTATIAAVMRKDYKRCSAPLPPEAPKPSAEGAQLTMF